MLPRHRQHEVRLSDVRLDEVPGAVGQGDRRVGAALRDEFEGFLRHAVPVERVRPGAVHADAQRLEPLSEQHLGEGERQMFPVHTVRMVSVSPAGAIGLTPFSGTAVGGLVLLLAPLSAAHAGRRAVEGGRVTKPA